jgi:hypothetical protein
LYRLAIPFLYQKVVANNADSIYLLLRTVIENPDLGQYVIQIKLNGRCGIQERHTFRRYGVTRSETAGSTGDEKGTEKEIEGIEKKGRKGESGKRRGILYELTLSKQDVQQLCAYAEKCELEETYIRSLQAGDRNFGEITSILLIMSLPSLKSLHLHQETVDKYKIFDQLLLELIPRRPKIFNHLTEFKRVSEGDWLWESNSAIMMSDLVPAILLPSIRTLTTIKACRSISHRDEYPESLDLFNLTEKYYETSPVESIYLHNCLIRGIELEPLLIFPRSLRLLSLVPWTASTPNFLSLQRALTGARANIRNSLVVLHIGRSHWKLRDYDPSSFFRLFKRLERLAVPVELLLRNGEEPLTDWQSFFPPTLIHLTFIALDSFMDPDFNHLGPLIEEQIKSKRRGEIQISHIGADSWVEVDPLRLMRLINLGEEVGITLARVKDSEKPFDYDGLKLEGVWISMTI